jgi:hypothetical protein
VRCRTLLPAALFVVQADVVRCLDEKHSALRHHYSSCVRASNVLQAQVISWFYARRKMCHLCLLELAFLGFTIAGIIIAQTFNR